MRVLITGGAGFIGSHLSEALVRRGDQVVVLDNLVSSPVANLAGLTGTAGFRLVQGSVTDPTLVQSLVAECEAVVHLAVPSGGGPGSGSGQEQLVTAVGTAGVVAAVSRWRQRLIVASGAHVYPAGQPEPLCEDPSEVLRQALEIGWASSEPRSRHEETALSARNAGVPVSVVRIFNTVGPRPSAESGATLARLVRQAVNGEPLVVADDGAQRVCLGHVEDVVDGILACLDRPQAAGNAFNLGSSVHLSVAELAQLVIERAGAASGLEYRADAPSTLRPTDDETRLPYLAKAAALLGHQPRWSPEAMVDQAITLARQTTASRVAAPSILRAAPEPVAAAAPVPAPAAPTPPAPSDPSPLIRAHRADHSEIPPAELVFDLLTEDTEPDGNSPEGSFPPKTPVSVMDGLHDRHPRRMGLPAAQFTPPADANLSPRLTALLATPMAPPPYSGRRPGRISVVVPVYDEERFVAQAIERIRAVDVDMELIVVDDGSTDHTMDELRQVAALIDVVISHPENRGKGAAVRTGLTRATADIIVLQDSDLELDPAIIPALVRPIRSGQADWVNGSRIHDGNADHVRPAQWWGNRFVSRLSSRLYGQPIADVASAAKAFRRDVLDRIDLESERFELEAELVAKLSRLGARVTEIPIGFTPRSRAEGKKVQYRDGLKVIRTLYRYRDWKTKEGDFVSPSSQIFNLANNPPPPLSRVDERLAVVPVYRPRLVPSPEPVAAHAMAAAHPQMAQAHMGNVPVFTR